MIEIETEDCSEIEWLIKVLKGLAWSIMPA